MNKYKILEPIFDTAGSPSTDPHPIESHDKASIRSGNDFTIGLIGTTLGVTGSTFVAADGSRTVRREVPVPRRA